MEEEKQVGISTPEEDDPTVDCELNLGGRPRRQGDSSASSGTTLYGTFWRMRALYYHTVFTKHIHRYFDGTKQQGGNETYGMARVEEREGQLLAIGSRLHCYPSLRQGDQRPVFITAASTQRRRERCQLCIDATDLSIMITPDFWSRTIYARPWEYRDRPKPNRQHPASAAKDDPTPDGADSAYRDSTASAGAPPPPVDQCSSAAPLASEQLIWSYQQAESVAACTAQR